MARGTSWCILAAIVVVCSDGFLKTLAEDAPPTTYIVDVLFLANYSIIASNIDDFQKQFQVMMMRTRAVTTDDVDSLTTEQSEHGSVLVHVHLRSSDAAAKLSDAVLDRHLSVYINGIGYIGIIPGDMPKTTKAPEQTTNPEQTTATQSPKSQPRAQNSTTDAPPVTEHPSQRGFVWLNEYTSDSENINDCSGGHAWSGVVVSRMPVGCHHFQHAWTKQDEYNFLSTKNGEIRRFGMICDPMCNSCISQVENMTYNNCVATWGGSIATFSESSQCIGGSYIEAEEGALSILRYSSSSCDLKNDMAMKLYIRSYPPVPMNANTSCRPDGLSGKFYSLSKVADEQGNVYYNGLIDCSDEDCSTECTEVKSWQEDSCQRDSSTGNGIMLSQTSDVLKVCTSTAATENGNTDTQSGTKPQVQHSSGADLDSNSKGKEYDNNEKNKQTNDNISDSMDHIIIPVAHIDDVKDVGADAMEASVHDVVQMDGKSSRSNESQNPNHSSTPSSEQSMKNGDNQMSPGSKLFSDTKDHTKVADDSIASDMQRPDAINSDTQGANENKKMANVMIAAGCVMGVAFITIGVIYRKKLSRHYDDAREEYDEYYAEYDYDCYDQYDSFDDKLLTEI